MGGKQLLTSKQADEGLVNYTHTHTHTHTHTQSTVAHVLATSLALYFSSMMTSSGRIRSCFPSSAQICSKVWNNSLVHNSSVCYAYM